MKVDVKVFPMWNRITFTTVSYKWVEQHCDIWFVTCKGPVQSTAVPMDLKHDKWSIFIRR